MDGLRMRRPNCRMILFVAGGTGFVTAAAAESHDLFVLEQRLTGRHLDERHSTPSIGSTAKVSLSGDGAVETSSSAMKGVAALALGVSCVWACRQGCAHLQGDASRSGARYSAVSSSERDGLLSVDAPGDGHASGSAAGGGNSSGDEARQPSRQGSGATGSSGSWTSFYAQLRDAGTSSSLPNLGKRILLSIGVGPEYASRILSPDGNMLRPCTGDDDDGDDWTDRHTEEEKKGLLSSTVEEEDDEDSMAAVMKLRPSARDSVGDDEMEEGSESARPIVGSERAGHLQR